jgi:hypothetical protein
MNVNTLQRGLILLGIVVNVAFLLINLKPARPHLARQRHAKILLRADPDRAKWVRENQLEEFAAAHDLQFEVVTAHSFEEVLSILEKEKAKPSGLLLAAIDSGIADELRKKNALRPLQSVIPAATLNEALAQYIPEASERSRGADNQIWFIPKRAEVDVAVYLVPAVEDAYLHWEQDRGPIAAALAEANGVGLPNHYQLEKSPDEWDSYDLFVAAWYWAHHPAPWADSPTEVAPRVALRTGVNEDAMNDLFAAFYRHGVSRIELAKPGSTAVLDAFQWEALLRKHHLLAAACEAPKGIDSDGVNDLFKARKLAWAPINQEDSLWLHGGSQRNAVAGIRGPEDLGWAMLPAGASLEMNGGEPARAAKSFSFTRLQLWALPLHSPDPELGFELATFLTERGPHQREAEAQGLLPIRQDIRADYPILFRLAWMQRILDASYRQIAGGSAEIPPEVAYERLDDLYFKLRAAVVYGRAATAPVTLAAIRAAVLEATHGK